MSIPRDHHYLPQFYTARWANGGSMIRYLRPTPHAPLHGKPVVPKGIGWQRDLYAYSGGATEQEQQRLELQLFGPIDTKAAKALQKIDDGQPGSTAEKIGLVQFVLSLQLRSPSRIKHLRNDFADRMRGVQDFDPLDPAHQVLIGDQINDVISGLISSSKIIALVANMKVFRIVVSSQHKLLTCDLPLMISQGIAQPQGFIMFPYAPDSVAIFAHDAKVAAAFSTQEPDILARGLNDAVSGKRENSSSQPTTGRSASSKTDF